MIDDISIIDSNILPQHMQDMLDEYENEKSGLLLSDGYELGTY